MDLLAVQRRTLAVLVAGQVLTGLGMGASLSTGALVVVRVSGQDGLAGLAATLGTLGAAAAAVPLARLARRGGRRVSLGTAVLVAAAGALLCVLGASAGLLAVLLVGLGLLGAGSAASLQARFAATDLAPARVRGRHLSLVVWSTTIGAVAGPNLVAPGDVLGAALGLAPLAGVFVFPLVSQLVAAALYLVVMRPDPLLVARAAGPRAVADAGAAGPLSATAGAGEGAGAVAGPDLVVAATAPDDGRGDPPRARFAVLAVALSHAAMVALMAMTPVHLEHAGVSLPLIGLTISAHIAGMYALSPVFGVLSDVLGRVRTVLLGQGLLLAAGLVVLTSSDDRRAVVLALVLLGLGWSAATVSGSALLSDAAPEDRRVVLQGRSDLLMNLAGATGGALAGPVLALVGYPGVGAAIALPVAVVVVAAAAVRRRSPSPVPVAIGAGR